MRFSQQSCEILDMFRDTHRHPGARVTIATLDSHFGTDPSVAVALSELRAAGYLTAPDAGTVQLTAKGFDAIQSGTYRTGED